MTLVPPPGGRRHGSLSSVARKAGVSLGTVSKVVHGRPDVGAETRARIEALLVAEGYRRSPGTERPNRLLVVFRNLESPYASEVVQAAIAAAAAEGVEVQLGTTRERPASAWMEASRAPGTLGIVLTVSQLSESEQQGILARRTRLVMLDPFSAPVPGITHVRVSDRRGARSAVDHLVGLGHRRVGLVAGRPHSLPGAERVLGYRDGLAAAGIAHDPQLVRGSDFDFDAGRAAAAALLAGPDRPTALFATSDIQALGALEAARTLGLRVPQDLSVVSFDGTAAARMAGPALTSVTQPFAQMGRLSVQLVLDQQEGVVAPVRPSAVEGGERHELETVLEVRASTGPPPA